MAKNIYTKNFDKGFKKTNINYKKTKSFKKSKKNEETLTYSSPKIKINFYTKDSLSFCCYRFLNAKNEIIYVGRAKNLIHRLESHNHLPRECYEQVQKIEYCKFNNNDDLDLAEPYFISKWKPKYNQDFKNKRFSFEWKELDTKEWKSFSKGIDIINKLSRH